MKFYVFPLKEPDAFKGGYPFKGIRQNHLRSGNPLKETSLRKRLLKELRQPAMRYGSVNEAKDGQDNL